LEIEGQTTLTLFDLNRKGREGRKGKPKEHKKGLASRFQPAARN
jgi:hypothetical protein